MTNIFHSLAVVLLSLLMVSCTSTGDQNNTDENNSNEEMTISGIVGPIENGKDGYTTPIKTETGDTYIALVSISNVGGMENYTRFNVGDMVTVSGKVWKMGEENHLTVQKIIKVDSSQTSSLILEDSYRGIQPGDNITTHQSYLQQDKLETGDGSFEIYRIKAENQNDTMMGYFFPDPNNEALVGDIVIDIPQAQTAQGIHVGSTFEDLKAKLPQLEVHGSEVEGRTYARHNNLSYRLDVANFSYEIDSSKIPADTKITEIVINRMIE